MSGWQTNKHSLNLPISAQVGPALAGAVSLVLLLARPSHLVNEYSTLGVFLVLYVLSELNFVRMPRGKLISFGSPIIFVSIFVTTLEISLAVASFGYLVSRAYLLFANALDRTNSNFLEIELYKNLWAITSMNGFFFLTGFGIEAMPEIFTRFLYLVVLGGAYFFIFTNIDYLLKIRSSWDKFYDYFVYIQHVYLLYVLYISFTILMIILYADFGLWSVVMLYFPLFMGKYSFVLYFGIKQSYIDIARAFSGVMDPHTMLPRDQIEQKVEMIMRIAKKLGMRGYQLETLHYAAYLHDIGHFGIDEDSFDAEVDRVSGGKLHSDTGSEILSNVSYFDKASAIVRHHHRSYRDLKKHRDEEFYVPAQILKICCDIYELILKDRRRSSSDVIEFIKNWTGSEYDPAIAELAVEEFTDTNAA